MSFNLLAEGALDYEEVVAHLASFEPLELFPVPPSRADELPALGIACPRSCCGDDAAAALERVVRFLWARHVRVYALFGGNLIADDAALEEVKSIIR